MFLKVGMLQENRGGKEEKNRVNNTERHHICAEMRQNPLKTVQ
jgi:hypothetical protein